MTSLVLDTHSAIWYWSSSPRLSETAAAAIHRAKEEGNPLFISSVSIDVIDDDWIISRVDEHVELTNVRTGHVSALGYDHIFGYVSEPGRNRGGIKYGFLQLRVQVSLRGQQLAIEPLPPGDWGQASEQPSPEDALQKAKRVNAQAKAHADRERLLETKGSEAVRKEHESLRTILDQKVIELQPHLTAIKIERGSDGHEYLLRTDRVSLNFYLYPTYPVTESRIVVQEFDGALILPKDRGHRMFVAGEEPRQVSKKEFYFDYRKPVGWYWAEKGANKAALDSAGLADQIIALFLDLHARFEGRKRTFRNDDR